MFLRNKRRKFASTSCCARRRCLSRNEDCTATIRRRRARSRISPRAKTATSSSPGPTPPSRSAPTSLSRSPPRAKRCKSESTTAPSTTTSGCTGRWCTAAGRAFRASSRTSTRRRPAGRTPKRGAASNASAASAWPRTGGRNDTGSTCRRRRPACEKFCSSSSANASKSARTAPSRPAKTCGRALVSETPRATRSEVGARRSSTPTTTTTCASRSTPRKSSRRRTARSSTRRRVLRSSWKREKPSCDSAAPNSSTPSSPTSTGPRCR
mmetsp:Transcript_19559/g.60452  ORF Transcript_19559/g.60452 Transcript_19559/m.60452 type:complete len:267 (-) Transcript_19559:525-1325(-)